MGNSFSPILCDFVVTDIIIDWTCNELQITPKFIGKYVDDLFAILPKDSTTIFLNKMNDFHPNIKFTIEEPTNGSLPYLDTRLTVKDNKLITDWYCKPTSRNRILNFLSAHNVNMKINTAKGLLNRIFSLSNECFWDKNEEIATNILLKNNYPGNLIKNLLSLVKRNLRSTNMLHITTPVTDRDTKYCSLT